MWGPMLRIAACATGVKLLLVPAYRSTDFEVHRNWLAVTGSLPVSKWYRDETSEWTLDYPPFFAWFEWILSYPARLVDPRMLDVDNLNYDSSEAVLFQRCSVMVSDAALLAAVVLAARGSSDRGATLAALVLGSAGLIVVDHIHFQYNGMMMGLFLSSLLMMAQERELLAGVAFAVLLNTKHIYVYCAPVFFVHLLCKHCFVESVACDPGASWTRQFSLFRFFRLAVCVAAVFGLSLGPVAATGQLSQLAARLFPFGRGLCHAYWAANVWALYSALDKVLAISLPRLFGVMILPETANMTGGLVGVAKFAVLPQVSPALTAFLVLLAQAPMLWRLARHPSPYRIVHAVAYACMCSFMLGYHVHEKAALMVTLPLALLAIESKELAGQYLFCSTVAHYALLPLIFTRDEYFIKVLLIVLHAVVSTYLLHWWHGRNGGPASKQPSSPRCSAAAEIAVGRGENESGSLLARLEWFYLAGLGAVELYCAVGHAAVFGAAMPFLPLLLTSVYCASGMVYAWGQLMIPYMRKAEP